MKAKFRIIGDAHGRFHKYITLAEGAEYSLQVGDMSNTTYAPLAVLDPENHKVIAGNHDILDVGHPRYFGNDPHFLGDYGIFEVPEIGDVFYVRGAFSIDGVRENEEIPVIMHQEVIDLYSSVKPEIMVTHQSPEFLSSTFGSVEALRSFGWTREPVTATGKLLEKLFNIHEPKLQVCGHYHYRQEIDVRGTHFVCLDMIRDAPAELCYLDVDQDYLSCLVES